MTTSENYDYLVVGKSFQNEVESKKIIGVRIESEAANYAITYEGEAEGYSPYRYGTNPDVTNNRFKFNGSSFATFDRDYSEAPCTRAWGPWWLQGCGHFDDMNGEYPTEGEYLGESDDLKNPKWANGIIWKEWKGYEHSLKESTLMVRPQSFEN